MLAERLTAQLLSGAPARDPVQVVRRLLAVQAQDPRGARLAIRVRSEGLSAADVDRALTEDRSLLITWCNRGTLHLLAREDYPWLHALIAPTLFTASARRLAQEGVRPDAAERGVGAIERALSEDGPLNRLQLRARIDAAGVPTEGQALVHLLLLASLRGIIVRGPMLDGQHAYALVNDWLGPSKPVDRERALAELARRYLAGHGPADERDLARWSGLALRDARAGMGIIAAELNRRDDGLFELAISPEAAPLPAPRLLGAFEPVLLGWRSREQLIDPSEQRLVTVNGIFRAFALVNGRAVALWKLSAAGELALEPFAPIEDREQAALHGDGEDVRRFLGRYPGGGSAPNAHA
jgi:hypothetical protein